MKRNVIVFILGACGFIAMSLLIPFFLTNRVVSLAHIWRLGIFAPVFKYLIAFVGVLLSYRFAKSYIEVSGVSDTCLSEVKHYLICIVVCGLLAFGVGRTLGTHREDSDPLFGGGEIVTDYTVTDDQRIKEGLTFFIGLCIPALFGLQEGIAKERTKRRNSVV